MGTPPFGPGEKICTCQKQIKDELCAYPRSKCERLTLGVNAPRHAVSAWRIQFFRSRFRCRHIWGSPCSSRWGERPALPDLSAGGPPWVPVSQACSHLCPSAHGGGLGGGGGQSFFCRHCFCQNHCVCGRQAVAVTFKERMDEGRGQGSWARGAIPFLE